MKETKTSCTWSQRKRCRLRTINLSWSNIFTVASRIPGGRQLSSKSYLLLPNGLCALEMLGGCLSPLTNLLPYCHEPHPWKSLSYLFLSFKAFHTYFSLILPLSLSCLPSCLSLSSRDRALLLFSPTIPLPLRVTSSSFIVRVTVFRRSDHAMISRYSPLFYGTSGRAVVFFKVSRTSEIVPFIIDIAPTTHSPPIAPGNRFECEPTNTKYRSKLFVQVSANLLAVDASNSPSACR